jgi:hypothetical protein
MAGPSSARASMRSLLRRLAALLPIAAVAAACATSDPIEPPGEDGGGGAGGRGEYVPELVCLFDSCNGDATCAGCEGLTYCLLAERRCVACDPLTGYGCAEGSHCTSVGECAPDGGSCPIDDQGEPLVACAVDADCVDCDTMHRVCDLGTGRCVACTDANLSACAPDDICVDSRCTVDTPPPVCDHEECETGGPLGESCTMCTSALCAEDPYCCATAWDAQCVSEVAKFCTDVVCPAPTDCEHDECTTGVALDPTCSTCADAVCVVDAYCCTTAWDDQCVSEVAEYCMITC